jgi:iron(III) transport system substrate-binding protein
MNWFASITAASVIALGFGSVAAQAEIPAGYPANYAATIAGARQEGKVVIYSVTDTKTAEPLLKDFQALYPGVRIEYHDMNSTEVYNRFISESVGGTSADVVWSSAMDLQVKLVNDGYAQPYRSPETAKLPAWAVWRGTAFGTTYEPAVFVYNTRLLPPAHVPRTHADFERVLRENPALFKGKVTTYDAEKSGIGFMLVTQDQKAQPHFWQLARSIGAVKPVLQSSTGTMMERISSGEILIGYNIVGSYALSRSKRDKSIGIVTPSDYVLVLSRVLFIAKNARNLNAARLWVDYLLSHRGQTVISRQALLGSVRADVEGETSVSALTTQFGEKLKPIPVNEHLLAYLNPQERLAFLKKWSHSVRPRN